MSYKLGFDEQAPNPTDKVFERDGVKLINDSKSFLYLTGTELDFSDGLNGKGFVFNNPNAKRTCGCGSSFST
jgi:iron-sulfur cluster assembly protein